MIAPRYLTKSLFKLGLECPTKLFYTGKPGHYANAKLNDDFLQSLADGGFQVGEMAKMQFPEGVEVLTQNHEEALAETAELLQRKDVTIFEAAIRFKNLFIRIDILKKTDTLLEIIEVKAKSYDSRDGDFFESSNGKIKSTQLAYLYDIAFQKYVVSSEFPRNVIKTYLMMPDKSRKASVDRLNQRFKISRNKSQTKVLVDPELTSTALGTPLLSQILVDSYA